MVSIRFFNNTKLWKKFILTYVVIIIVPICIVGYFLTNRVQDVSFESSIRFTDASVQQLGENLKNRVGFYRNIIDEIVDDWNFNKFVSTNYDHPYLAYVDYMTYINPILTRSSYKSSGVLIKFLVLVEKRVDK